MPLIDDNGDVHIAADSRGDGIGSIVLSTGGVERARIGPSGVGTGILGGALTAVFSTQGVLGVAVGTGTFPIPRPGKILGVVTVVNTAPVGASLICDVNLNGTTVFTTQANRPTITSGSFISALVVPDVTTVALLNVLTVDVDQVGVSVAGSDLTTLVLIA